MRSLTWIPITAMAGGTQSLAWQETKIFVRRWQRRGEGERCYFPGSAAHRITLTKSYVCTGRCANVREAIEEERSTGELRPGLAAAGKGMAACCYWKSRDPAPRRKNWCPMRKMQ